MLNPNPAFLRKLQNIRNRTEIIDRKGFVILTLIRNISSKAQTDEFECRSVGPDCMSKTIYRLGDGI